MLECISVSMSVDMCVCPCRFELQALSLNECVSPPSLSRRESQLYSHSQVSLSSFFTSRQQTLEASASLVPPLIAFYFFPLIQHTHSLTQTHLRHDE